MGGSGGREPESQEPSGREAQNKPFFTKGQVVAFVAVVLLIVGIAVANEMEKRSPTFDRSSSATSDTSKRCVTAESGNVFCDETADGGFDTATAYESNRQTCSAFGVAEVAREYGMGNNPESAAMGAAEGYQGRSHQAAYEGCLDGFKE